jgi:Spy/CpxP family protein refolding chaperone
MMTFKGMGAIAAAALIALSAATFAAEGDKPATPAAGNAASKSDVKGVRLIKPYSDLRDLTPEQTTRLKEIHKKYSDEIKELEARQKEEMTAILTEAQKKELGDMPATSKKTPKGKMKDEAPAAPAAPANPK